MFFTQSNIFARVPIQYSFKNFTLYAFQKKPNACSLILDRGHPIALNFCENNFWQNNSFIRGR